MPNGSATAGLRKSMVSQNTPTQNKRRSMMSEFIVHSAAGSPFGRAVLVTLVEKGAAFRFAPVVPGTLKNEPHILLHPFGRIPVLEHDGFMLYETQAIMRYLD